MAIIAHEGLPRSGKSFSAIKDWIVPQLKSGRTVVAYVEGLNHKRIGEIVGITEDECRARLLTLTREQVPSIWQEGVVTDGCFLVLDEVQNFWPKQRKVLDDGMTRFITEHGHRGLDILIMGQDMKDVHTTWFNRIDTKYVFVKKDSVGKPNQFHLSVQKRSASGKFVETSNSSGEYETAYFDTYKSHVDGAKSVVLGDERAVIWNHPVFKRIKKFGVLVVIAVGVVIWLFSGGLGGVAKDAQKDVKEKRATESPVPPLVVSQAPVQVPAPVVAQPVMPVISQQPQQALRGEVSDPDRDRFVSIDMLHGDPVADLFRIGRARLSSVMVSGRTVSGNVQFWTDTGRMIDSLSFRQLRELGWNVFLSEDRSLAIFRRNGAQFLATGWQVMDGPGRSPTALQDRIRGEGAGSVDPVSRHSSGVESPGGAGGSAAGVWPPDGGTQREFPRLRDLPTAKPVGMAGQGAGL